MVIIFKINKTLNFSTNFGKILKNTKFRENPCIGSRDGPYG